MNALVKYFVNRRIATLKRKLEKLEINITGECATMEWRISRAIDENKKNINRFIARRERIKEIIKNYETS